MGSYFIKDNDLWLGPMSQSEFNSHKESKEEFVYWKQEFCPNKVLHPHLCSHHKSWVKPPEPEVKSTSHENFNHKQLILDAKPLSAEEAENEFYSDDKNASKREPIKQENAAKDQGITHKLLVIIIGFILVLVAGYYVNSKLSIMFYQDIIIQESVKDIEYYSRDMINETKEIRQDIDTLNAVMSREFKAIRKEINDIRLNNNK